MGPLQTEFVLRPPAATATVANDWPRLVWHAGLPVILSLVFGFYLSMAKTHCDDSESRHACDQGDGLSGYTWTEYDARHGGVQVLNDPKNNVQITTEFLKVHGGSHGGSWAARIKGKPLDPGKTIFYIPVSMF